MKDEAIVSFRYTPFCMATTAIIAACVAAWVIVSAIILIAVAMLSSRISRLEEESDGPPPSDNRDIF